MFVMVRLFLFLFMSGRMIMFLHRFRFIHLRLLVIRIISSLRCSSVFSYYASDLS